MSETVIHLERHLKAAQSKRPGWAVGLWGEAGVGKTFTVQSLLAQSATKSLSLHSGISEKSLAQHIPHPPKLPLWAEHILERLTTNQAVNTQALLDALLAVLSELAPFVVHLEDLHEVGEGRLEFIQNLAKAIPRIKGVGLIVTSRSEPPEAFKGYRLVPLTKPESDALLESKAQAKLPVEGLEWVYSRAQGNALFSAEFWRYLTRQGFFWSDGQSWQWRRPPDDFVPVSIEALISTMLSNLDQSARRAMEARSMFASEVELKDSDWAEMADLQQDEFEQIKTHLEIQGILKGDGFAHPLFHTVVRQEIPPDRRQSHARHAVQQLRDNPELIVHLVEEAGLSPEQQIHHYQQAATAAERMGLVGQAGHWLGRAAQISSGPSRSALAYQAALHLGVVEPPASIDLLELALADDPTHQKAAILLATNYARLGRYAEMNRVLSNLPDHVKSQENWTAAEIMIRQGQEDHREVVALWNQHPELHANPDPDTAFRVGFALMELNQPHQAEVLIGPSLGRPDLSPLQRVKLLAASGMSRRLIGDLEAARSFLEEAKVWASQCGPANMASTLHNHQIVLQMLGLFSEAEGELREAIELYRSVGMVRQFASSLSSLGVVLFQMGRYEEAESRLLEAHQILYRLEPSGFLCTVEGNLCELYLAWQPPHGLRMAQKYAQLALEHGKNLEPRHQARALICTSAVACELGQAERALELANTALELDQVNAMGQTHSLYAKAVALEKLGFAAEALATLQQAHTTIVDETDRHWINLELARLNHDPGAAQDSLDWFHQHNLLWVDNHLARKWPALQVSTPTTKASINAQPSLQLNVLGTPSLLQNGQPITYRGKKRLEILCYLLEARIAGKDEVSLLELLDTFYQGMPEDKAKLTLRQQIYLIRNDLGSESILSTSNGYTLGSIHSDAEIFLQTNQSNLWSGPYLKGLTDGWNANVRDGLELALRSCAERLLGSDATEAARLGQIWLEMEPYDLEALHLCVRALHRDNPKAAARTYQQARERMLEVGEELPESPEEFLSEEAVAE